MQHNFLFPKVASPSHGVPSNIATSGSQRSCAPMCCFVYNKGWIHGLLMISAAYNGRYPLANETGRVPQNPNHPNFSIKTDLSRWVSWMESINKVKTYKTSCSGWATGCVWQILCLSRKSSPFLGPEILLIHFANKGGTSGVNIDSFRRTR